eukprot:g17852.t1
MADKVLGMVSRTGMAAAGLAAIPAFFLYNVDGGERAVMFNRFSGVSDMVSGEGTHFMVPWLMAPYRYDIRVRPKLIQTTTGSGIKTKQERQATVIRSEGEAEAATLISEALKEHGTGMIDMRRIDASKEIAELLAKSPNVMYMPGGQNMLLNMNAGR